MRTARNGKPGTNTVLLLVGATKGVCLLRGDRRRIWRTGGLDTKVGGGSTITIITAVNGG